MTASSSPSVRRRNGACRVSSTEASSSGATVYVEPLETLTLNNELVELQDREFAEIQRILGEFTRKLQERRDDLARDGEHSGRNRLGFREG